jgi:Rrf2 family protein
MKMTRATNYALHALAYLARRGHERPMASHDIAHAEGVPERFLLKVLKPLVSARILYSLKGPHGGYRLARPPEKIPLLEVVEAVDGPIRGQIPGVGADGAAALDKRLDVECEQLAALVRQQLRKVSLKDLAGKAK